MTSDDKLTLRIHICRHDSKDGQTEWTVSRDECGPGGEARSMYILARVSDQAEAQELAREIGRKQGLPVYSSVEGSAELIQLPNAACA